MRRQGAETEFIITVRCGGSDSEAFLQYSGIAGNAYAGCSAVMRRIRPFFPLHIMIMLPGCGQQDNAAPEEARYLRNIYRFIIAVIL